jgi:hypothetical protein
MDVTRIQLWTRRLGVAIMILIGLLAARIAVQDFTNQFLRLTGAPDPACGMNYCDAALFWIAGRLSRAGDVASIYDASAFARAAAQMLPAQRHYLPFVYPPPALLPASLLSLASVKTSYVVATAGLTGASCYLFRKAGLSWAVIALALLSPAGLWAIYLGQFGVIGAALLLAGIARLSVRPARSGVLLSLLCLKPQYALLVPVILFAGRQWRALICVTACVAALIAASMVWPGVTAWHAFALAGRATETNLLQAPFGPGYEFHGASIFWMLRSFGAGLSAAYAAQAISALLAAILAWHLWRREDDRRLPITLCLFLLVTPYGFTDDMVGYSIAAAMLLRPNAPLRNAALAALWLAPGYSGHFAALSGLSLTPLLVLALIAIGLTIPASPATGAHRSGWAQPLKPVPPHSPQ